MVCNSILSFHFSKFKIVIEIDEIVIRKEWDVDVIVRREDGMEEAETAERRAAIRREGMEEKEESKEEKRLMHSKKQRVKVKESLLGMN